MSSPNQAEKLKDTLNLPKTDFPMRANAVEREPERIKHWDRSEAYDRMQAKNSKKEAAVLEDPALPPIDPFLMSANAESVMYFRN